jgi:hypothetical protein
MALPMHLVQVFFLVLADVAATVIHMPIPEMAQEPLVFRVFLITSTVRLVGVTITLKAALRFASRPDVFPR